MNRHIRWLVPEVGQWVKEGLIEPAQGEAILERYPSPEAGIPWGKVIFSSIGAVLAGLGVILLFAYNWEAMPKAVKLAVILVSLAATHGAGWVAGRRRGAGDPLPEGLHLLGTMLFGAGIWLIGQIYHMDADYPNAFLAWGLGALGLAWALPSAAQAVLAALLLAVWSAFESLAFNHSHPAGPLLLLVGLGPLAWRMRSRVLTAVWLPAFLIPLCLAAAQAKEALLGPTLFCTACLLIGLGELIRRGRSFPEAAPILTLTGYLPYLGMLYALSFPGMADDLIREGAAPRMAVLYFAVPLAAAIGVWVMVPRRSRRPADPQSPGGDGRLVPLALVLFLLSYFRWPPWFGGWIAAAAFNLIFLAHAILWIRQGCRQVRMGLTAVGSLLFSLLAFSRYADLFESLILRGLVFLAVGAILFITGVRYTRAKSAATGGTP